MNRGLKVGIPRQSRDWEEQRLVHSQVLFGMRSQAPGGLDLALPARFSSLKLNLSTLQNDPSFDSYACRHSSFSRPENKRKSPACIEARSHLVAANLD